MFRFFLRRFFAESKVVAKKKARGAAPAIPSEPVTVSYGVGERIPNIVIKQGSEDPICRPLSEYPPWLVPVWEQMTTPIPRITPADIEAAYAASVIARERAIEANRDNPEFISPPAVYCPSPRIVRLARRTQMSLNNAAALRLKGTKNRIKRFNEREAKKADTKPTLSQAEVCEFLLKSKV